ncbi:MAG: ATP-binding protein [Ferruginibacter sp.]
MELLEISLQVRVAIGISAMVLLFCSFLVTFIANQRKKLQYHKDLQALHEEQKNSLVEQNKLLEQKVDERTVELQEKAIKLQETLTQLKASQLQLIQKEKMASLGELTAGIAHEIQNPLNFVNNFAEINADLLAEVIESLANASLPENVTKEIDPLVADITTNLQKIMQHGKRADNIVKNMLQHSQKLSGEIEFTDLNALAEEYLRISYQSFRSKNKTFSCNTTTSFDENTGMINLIKEDIGRILINLFNNAFYSMKEKIRIAGSDFQPAILLSTQKMGNKVLVSVKDNGIGISQGIIDKIYQPFFTTKPTGEGTGLGLSMSYDIIKAHQGEIKVNSVAGEFAEFIIELGY